EALFGPLDIGGGVHADSPRRWGSDGAYRTTDIDASKAARAPRHHSPQIQLDSRNLPSMMLARRPAGPTKDKSMAKSLRRPLSLLLGALATTSIGGCYYGDVNGAYSGSYANNDCRTRYGDAYYDY